ncbi:MAG TPA: flagellar hook-basal body complex protein FliE [Thermoanaerobacterales bacterium]|nr:flagellar hook-basal body complex protein FliE [Thermoanaerobacterales bacterium]
MTIKNIKLTNSNNLNTSSAKSAKNDGKFTFKDLLYRELEKVNSLQKDMEYLNKKLVIGEVDNIHEVVIAAEKAEMALQITLQIRNKVLDAYNEIMRMQL